jgi:hypothetical protein
METAPKTRIWERGWKEKRHESDKAQEERVEDEMISPRD